MGAAERIERIERTERFDGGMAACFRGGFG